MSFFQRNWSPLFFYLSPSSSFSLIHVNVDVESKSKERIGFCCRCFYLQKSGKLCDLPPKHAGAWNAKFHPGLHEGVDVRTDVTRTDDFPRTKISWMHRLPNFLLIMLRCARESSAEMRSLQTLRNVNHFIGGHNFFEARFKISCPVVRTDGVRSRDFQYFTDG